MDFASCRLSAGSCGKPPKLLTRNEARRIAANIAKLPDLLPEQGRPRIQGQLRAGTGMLTVARECSVGTGTVQRIARWFHGGKN